MTYELGQIVEEMQVVWNWNQVEGWHPIEVMKYWEVVDIVNNGDIVIGEYNGECKVLYLRPPYVVGCNNPVPLKYHKK